MCGFLVIISAKQIQCILVYLFFAHIQFTSQNLPVTTVFCTKSCLLLPVFCFNKGCNIFKDSCSAKFMLLRKIFRTDFLHHIPSIGDFSWKCVFQTILSIGNSFICSYLEPYNIHIGGQIQSISVNIWDGWDLRVHNELASKVNLCLWRKQPTAARHDAMTWVRFVLILIKVVNNIFARKSQQILVGDFSLDLVDSEICGSWEARIRQNKPIAWILVGTFIIIQILMYIPVLW